MSTEEYIYIQYAYYSCNSEEMIVFDYNHNSYLINNNTFNLWISGKTVLDLTDKNEEELFQLSTVIDFSLAIQKIVDIQKLFKKNNYKELIQKNIKIEDYI